MREKTRRAREAGFGNFVELLAPVYEMGQLLGMLDTNAKETFLVLKRGDLDVYGSYKKANRYEPHSRLYTISNLPEHSVMRKNEVARALPLFRGRTIIKECEDPEGPDRWIKQQFYKYMASMSRQILKISDKRSVFHLAPGQQSSTRIEELTKNCWLYLFKDSISVIDNQEIKDLVAKDYGKFVNMDDQILKNYAPLDMVSSVSNLIIKKEAENYELSKREKELEELNRELEKIRLAMSKLMEKDYKIAPDMSYITDKNRPDSDNNLGISVISAFPTEPIDALKTDKKNLLSSTKSAMNQYENQKDNREVNDGIDRDRPYKYNSRWKFLIMKFEKVLNDRETKTTEEQNKEILELFNTEFMNTPGKDQSAFNPNWIYEKLDELGVSYELII